MEIHVHLTCGERTVPKNAYAKTGQSATLTLVRASAVRASWERYARRGAQKINTATSAKSFVGARTEERATTSRESALVRRAGLGHIVSAQRVRWARTAASSVVVRTTEHVTPRPENVHVQAAGWATSAPIAVPRVATAMNVSRSVIVTTGPTATT